ncbi:MAG: ABC transporter substrate-binding protein [Desulfosporosinus sp.]|nr:ABC transporter substrate-binding protein [Desulfosporosinus sp.]
MRNNYANRDVVAESKVEGNLRKVYIVVILLPILAFVLSFPLGRHPISIPDLLSALAGRIFPFVHGPEGVINTVIFQVRLPRILAAMLLGAADKIIGQPSQKNFPQLMEMDPQFRNLPDVGSFDNINVEEIIKLKPDLVVASVTSPTGNKKLEEAGIPVVSVLTGRATIDGLTKEFKMMAAKDKE